METKDVLNLALAFYKDKVQSETFQRFHSEFDKLLETDAEARRAKVHTLVMHLAKLKIALQQFELTYENLKKKVGEVKAVDEYIISIKKEIQKISDDKNNHRLNE